MKIKINFYVKTIVIIVAMIFLIFFAKIIRYTIMKSVLVDESIGHGMIASINHNTPTIVHDGNESEEDINATERTAKIFKKMNIFELTTYEGFEIFITIFWNIILMIILFSLRKKMNIMQTIFLVLTILVLNIFDFNLAKEPIQMLYFVLIYFVIARKELKDSFKYILSFLILYCASITFRTYYILIAFFMLGASLICKIFGLMKEKLKFYDIIIITIALGLGYFLLLTIAQNVMPDEYAELVRVRTRETEAKTDISNLITDDDSNLLLFTLDYLLMLVRMMIPIELLSFGPKYWPYVAYQVMITFYIIAALKNIKKNHKSKNVALYVYLGFLCGSATFEPDFGSWVRHEAAIAPILFILADMYKFKQSQTDIVLREYKKTNEGE